MGCAPFAVGSLGTVAHRHADTADLAFVHVVGREEEVVAAVLADGGRRPHGPPRPRHVGLLQDAGVLRPVHQVVGGEAVEGELLVVGKAARGIDPAGSVVNDGFGIGIPSLENGVAAPFRRSGPGAGDAEYRTPRQREQAEKADVHNVSVGIDDAKIRKIRHGPADPRRKI